MAFPSFAGGWDLRGRRSLFVGGVEGLTNGGLLLNVTIFLTKNFMQTRRTGSALALALSGTLRVTLDRGPAVGITSRRVSLGRMTGGRA